MVFCSDRRPELKAEQPELPFGELSKVRRCLLVTPMLCSDCFASRRWSPQSGRSSARCGLWISRHACVCADLRSIHSAIRQEDRLPYALRAAERTASAPPRLAKAPKAPKGAKRAARSSSPDIDFEHESLDADAGEFGPAPAKKRAGVDAHGYDWCVCFPASSAAALALTALL
jgi:hypothetical protein